MAVIAHRLWEIWWRQENLPVIEWPLTLVDGVQLQRQPMPCGQCGREVTIARCWSNGQADGATHLLWVGHCQPCGVQSGQRITARATPEGDVQAETSVFPASRTY